MPPLWKAPGNPERKIWGVYRLLRVSQLQVYCPGEKVGKSQEEGISDILSQLPQELAGTKG
jgi:hypothetical protein